jgi:alpha-beta hydrolase superfamily lysophospholipase
MSEVFERKDADYIRNTIKHLNMNSPANSEHIFKYFNFYNINLIPDSHYFGYFDSGKNRIASHIFINEKSRGSVFLIHGYLEHSAVSFRNIIPLLLKSGYSIAAIDLPGHGFSDGRRGDVNDFSEYLQAIKGFYKKYLINMPPPYSIIGHSTGCTGIIDALYYDKLNFKSYILLSPLIRSDLWLLTKTGMFLFGWFLKKVPASANRGTNNKSHADFLYYKDPLYIRWIPLSWVRAHFRWERKLNNYNKNNKKIYILQGKKDKSLSWKYNMKYLLYRFPNSTVKYFKNANHNLFSEPEPLKEKIINSVLHYLK